MQSAPPFPGAGWAPTEVRWHAAMCRGANIRTFKCIVAVSYMAAEDYMTSAVYPQPVCASRWSSMMLIRLSSYWYTGVHLLASYTSPLPYPELIWVAVSV